MKGFKETMGITSMSLGFGLIGDSLGGDIGSKLAYAGKTTSNFISPAINISMGSYTIKQLKQLKNVK